MCEYCGCQAFDAIAELMAEHDAVVALIGGVRTAAARADLAGVAALSRDMADVLRPHTAVEEQGLFPAMELDFPDAMGALELEHREIEAVLAEAVLNGTKAHMPKDPTWLQRLLPALDMLRDHMLKEQDGVFPAALATLQNEDWERVGEVRATVGSAVHTAA